MVSSLVSFPSTSRIIPVLITLRQLLSATRWQAAIRNVSLTVHPGWKVGLTGANGSGKSTLFALLRDELHPTLAISTYHRAGRWPTSPRKPRPADTGAGIRAGR